MDKSGCNQQRYLAASRKIVLIGHFADTIIFPAMLGVVVCDRIEEKVINRYEIIE